MHARFFHAFFVKTGFSKYSKGFISQDRILMKACLTSLLILSCIQVSNQSLPLRLSSCIPGFAPL